MSEANEQEILSKLEKRISHIQAYIDSLRNNFKELRTSKGEEEELSQLKVEFYYRLACTHLNLLATAVLDKNERKIQESKRKFLENEKEIKGNKYFSGKLKQAIGRITTIEPLFEYFLRDISPPSSSFQQNRPHGPRLASRKTDNRIHAIQSIFLEDEGKGGPAAKWRTNYATILKELNNVDLLKSPAGKQLTKLEELAGACLRLEKDIYNDIKRPENKFDQTLSYEDLVDLHSDTVNFLIIKSIKFLDIAFIIYLKAGMLPEAIDRLKIMEMLLREKSPLPPSFIELRARVLALNGDHTEWLKLRTEKQLKKEETSKELAEVRRALINKKIEEQKRREQERQKLISEMEESVAPPIQKASIRQENEAPISPFERVEPSLQISGKREIVLPSEKVKTRKPVSNTTVAEMKEEKILPGKASTSSSTQKLRRYYLPKSAFVTFTQIQNLNWNLNRERVYNLFEQLGCQVDESSGKGSHGKISIAGEAIIREGQEVIAVLPQFTVQNLGLTIPQWDNKRGGMVPPYLAKSIMRALETLGANKDTVHKKNEKS